MLIRPAMVLAQHEVEPAGCKRYACCDTRAPRAVRLTGDLAWQRTKRSAGSAWAAWAIPMAERLLKAGYDVSIWNRTRAKAEPLAAKRRQDRRQSRRPRGVDVLFSIVSTGKDLEEVYSARTASSATAARLPTIFVDCSTIAVEESADDPRPAQAARRAISSPRR